MKGKIKGILILLIVILLINGLYMLGEYGLGRSMDGIEAGNFINSKDLNLNKITMLHWFSKEVEVYSDTHEDLCFVLFGKSYNDLSMYMNKKLIIQNQSPSYPMFQDGNYMIFTVDNSDYIDKRVSLYSEATLRDNYIDEYDNNYYVGNLINIGKLVVNKQIINILSKILFLLSIILYIISRRRDLVMILLAITALYILVDVRVGTLLCLLLFYFDSDKLINRKIRNYIIIIFATLSMVIPYLNNIYIDALILNIDLVEVFIVVLLILSFICYCRKNSKDGLLSTIGILSVYIFISKDLEFSYFRLFYNESCIIIVAIIILAKSTIDIKKLCSNNDTVKKEFLRGIGHDFKIPLSTIKLNVELLSKDDFTVELNKAVIIHTIKGAIEDLTNMVTSLTAYISTDKYVSIRSKTSVQDSIDKTIAYFSNNKKNIDIRSDICLEEVFLPIEEVWLNRLIYNLIDNSYKYTNEYGEIVISLKKEKGKVILMVQDNGVGIEADKIAKVMEPFYRADESRSVLGLGLGLSIVKSIVDKLNGYITIESKIDVGTNIIIRV